MEAKITILKEFFEDPEAKFSIRQLARKLKKNHTTVRQHLSQCAGQGILSSRKQGVYTFYSLELNKKALNLKLYYNLEKIRISGIVEDLEKQYDFPVIVLFGSFASAYDTKSSDIDICLISDIKKDFKTKKYEKNLNRKISLHKFTRASWKKSGKNTPSLINSICNGIVLSGELEVL